MAHGGGAREVLLASERHEVFEVLDQHISTCGPRRG
jgi:hypothetical protein